MTHSRYHMDRIERMMAYVHLVLAARYWLAVQIQMSAGMPLDEGHPVSNRVLWYTAHAAEYPEPDLAFCRGQFKIALRDGKTAHTFPMPRCLCSPTELRQHTHLYGSLKDFMDDDRFAPAMKCI